MSKNEIIREALTKEGADAWVIVDYENRNKTLVEFLGNRMLTRKIFLVFPLDKKPFIICHSIDTVFLRDEEITKTFDLKVYHTWQEMLDIEKKEFAKYKKVLMDISEFGLLPRISLADYGSVEFIKSLGIEVASSGNLLQRFSALYSDIICDRFHEEGMVYDDPAIVAIGKNASDPHYGPSKEVSSPIRKGDLVLIDMWAKMDDPEGVYADITWMGYVGEEVPEVYAKRFEILKKAIEADFEFLKNELPKRAVAGYEVDQISRDYIKEAGFAEYFVHRTGHNIAVDVSPHGPGVNIDNYESHDTREIIDGVTFSLEPGIYAPDFGMRSETNVYIKDRQPIYVAGHQEEIIPILK